MNQNPERLTWSTEIANTRNLSLGLVRDALQKPIQLQTIAGPALNDLSKESIGLFHPFRQTDLLELLVNCQAIGALPEELNLLAAGTTRLERKEPSVLATDGSCQFKSFTPASRLTDSLEDRSHRLR
jgi:hypothetical protein